MSKLKVLELFGGIGACCKALKRLDIDFEIVDYVDIDKYAVASFNAINNTCFQQQDVCTWDKNIEVDLLMHGSPCQDFSLSGKQAGGDEGSGTRSSLMYETIRIVKKLRPKFVIWENVKNILSKRHIHNFNNYISMLEDLGYYNYYEVLNAKDFGVPQNRERVFCISIRNDLNKKFVFPKGEFLKLKLKDMLEDDVEEKYYLTDKMLHYVLATNEDGSDNKFSNRVDECKMNKTPSYAITVRGAGGQQRGSLSNFIVDDGSEEIKVKDVKLKIRNATKKGYLEATDGDGVDVSSRMRYHRGTVQKEKIQTLDTKGNSRGVVVATSNINNLRIRKLTPKECWRLMGFDDDDFKKASNVNSNAQLYKQAGNSIVVNVLVEIFKNLLEDYYAKD